MKEKIYHALDTKPHTIQWLSRKTGLPAETVAFYLVQLIDENKVKALHFSARRKVYKKI